MYDEIMFSLLEYCSDIKWSASHLQKELFEQQTYSMWAAKEIYMLLAENETQEPEVIVEAFAKKMDEYSCMRRETSRMFSIAHDTAMDILDLIICIKQ